jgi:hypothetical protein
MKRQYILLLLTMAFVSLNGYSQKWKLTRYEVLFGGGTTHFFGDMGGTADKHNLWGLGNIFSNTGPSYFLGARYKLRQDLALKLNLIYGKGKGRDLNTRNEIRDFSFTTSFFEPSVQCEYYLVYDERRYYTPANLYNRRGMLNNYSHFGVYVFAGIGTTFFNPKFSYHSIPPNPAYHYVKSSPGFTAAIPFGIGIKTAIDKYWSVGFEFGRRFVFSDYLDGLSTAFSHHNDIYYFGIFNLIYKLKTDRTGVPYIFRRYRYLGG